MRGSTYRVATPTRDTTGEYLGVETGHGVWSILLRHAHGIDSIPYSQIRSVRRAAA
jgi:hypothetical protein